MIQVKNTVPVYEVDGNEAKMVGNDKPLLLVDSHWNNDNMVVLELDGKKITVLAKDLHAAVNNATNIARF